MPRHYLIYSLPASARLEGYGQWSGLQTRPQEIQTSNRISSIDLCNFILFVSVMLEPCYKTKRKLHQFFTSCTDNKGISLFEAHEAMFVY